ncbi:MAG: hypothetical protein RIR00_43 [Pseudomonadota bacterium]|jgi:2-hydroxychromene-2-carboxylate isomerase
MTAPLDFYFDFSSPYAYLLSEKIDALAARHGRSVNWHPVLLGVIFQRMAITPPAASNKYPYMQIDVARSARFLGLNYRHPPLFPLATQQAARAYYVLLDQQPELARPFAQAVFRAMFVTNLDISRADIVLDLAVSLGADRASLLLAMGSEDYKTRLKAACEAALGRGMFGAPYVLIDGEPFLGADRLEQMERWLAEGGF